VFLLQSAAKGDVISRIYNTCNPGETNQRKNSFFYRVSERERESTTAQLKKRKEKACKEHHGTGRRYYKATSWRITH
jgi:hypothetical protein